MTEAEWLACEDPVVMLQAVPQSIVNTSLRWTHSPSDHAARSRAAQYVVDASLRRRKAIFAFAACRLIWNHLEEESQKWLVEESMHEETFGKSMDYWTAVDCDRRREEVASFCLRVWRQHGSTSPMSDLVRDIFGNPFRPVVFSPSWRTDTAVALARQMCESRDFSAMPILADALQDAGCDNDDILNHCRDANAIHLRGCWVMDLVLGKS